MSKKPPGFIFYPGDYLRDTQGLSEKSQVAYDRIMCAHVRTHDSHMNFIGITYDQHNFFTKKLNAEEKSELKPVLEKIEDGFMIPWVADSVQKYGSYCKSRSKNRTGKTKKEISYDPHMDIDIDNNISIVESKKEKGGTGEKTENILYPPDFAEQCDSVTLHLNSLTGQDHSPEAQVNRSYVLQRYKEGHSIETLKGIITMKFNEWKSKHTMKHAITISTILGDKFDNYLQAFNHPIKETQNGTTATKRAGIVFDRP